METNRLDVHPFDSRVLKVECTLFWIIIRHLSNFKQINLLINKNKNTEDVWKSIIQNQGSVQHLDFLTDREKEVFKTFQEISPFTIIQQASARQYFIDQGQSINLKIPNAMSIRDVNKVHMEAWKLGLKGLYYQRGTSVAKEAVLSMMECKSCEA